MPLARLVARQRGQLFVWTPVALGTGIAAFFAFPVELVAVEYVALASLATLAGALACKAGETAAPALAALALVCTGTIVAGLRTHAVAAPVLEFRYHGPVEGRIVAVDRSRSDKPRLTLDRVVLANVPAGSTPHRVRISLHGDQRHLQPLTGQRIAVTAHLVPPPGAVEPFGFDFRRLAWFQRLGAVGYTRTPALVIAAPARGEPLAALGRLRLALSAGVQAKLDGQVGAFAAAVTTGDRSALAESTLTAMRSANLAHLLAISGLHLGLVSGVVFGGTRVVLAAVPAVALRVPARKIAAVVALVAAAGYLALSGGTVSTQRAFIMAAVFLTAVLLDRRALTLRSVALAAVIVLLWQPEALLGPGFQMSFAATAALVWAFARLRDAELAHGRPPRWTRGGLALVLSSAVAGVATAPFAAAHFNQTAVYGLAANLLAVPAMGAVVAPAGVAAALLAPFGLEGLALAPMGWGIAWILGVAERVAALEGAVRYIPAPPPGVLALLVAGGLTGLLVQGRAAFVSLLPIVVAIGLWAHVERPALLISDTGALIGVMTPEGRALNRRYTEGFVAESWLENDGRDRDRDAAYRRMAAFEAPGGFRATIGARQVAAVTRASEGRLARVCAAVDVVVSDRSGAPIGGCVLLDPRRLRDSGALAVTQAPGGDWRVRSVRDGAGARLWSRRDVRRAFAENPFWEIGRADRPGRPDRTVERELAERLAQEPARTTAYRAQE